MAWASTSLVANSTSWGTAASRKAEALLLWHPIARMGRTDFREGHPMTYRRTAAVFALTLAAGVALPSQAWAGTMTLDGPFCTTTSYTATTVTYHCVSLAQNGTAPYTYDWRRSKGIALTSPTSPTTDGTCSRGTLYRLDLVARDAGGQLREKDLGWQTCLPNVL
jgi:hypothetical protein